MFYLLFNWFPNCTVDLILSDKNLSNEDASKNVYSCADFNKWDFKYNFINVTLTYIQAVFWDFLIVVERNWSGNENQISVPKNTWMSYYYLPYFEVCIQMRIYYEALGEDA